VTRPNAYKTMSTGEYAAWLAGGGNRAPEPVASAVVPWTPPTIQAKATYGGILQSVYANDVPLSVYGQDPQQKAAAYLRAYKVGWFYKAGKKIAGDIAGLERTLSYEDTEGDNADEITATALTVPWEQLDPLEEFLRLMERPNPYQTGRTLFTKTEIRLDFAGAAFWYLEGGEGEQLPTGLYGISPSRMWPSVDA